MREVEFESLGRALARLGIVQGASEYHGTLCGTLCVAGTSIPLPLIDEIDATGSHADQDISMLQTLRQHSLAALLDAQMGFEPLLPDDDDHVEDRVDALAEWCQGFLWGIAIVRRLDMESLSEEVREVVQDFLEISRVGMVSDEDDVEADEAAYVEIVEYLRIGVQMVFLELYPGDGTGERADSQTH